MKIIVFRRNRGLAEHEAYEEEVEFDDNATEEEINEIYADWMIEQISNECTWYEKE